MSETYHDVLLRPFMAQATSNVDAGRHGGCVCDDADHRRSKITVEAWHLRWAMFDETSHDPGDEDRSVDPIEDRLRELALAMETRRWHFPPDRAT